jgi:hypothetical protein
MMKKIHLVFVLLLLLSACSMVSAVSDSTEQTTYQTIIMRAPKDSIPPSQKITLNKSVGNNEASLPSINLTDGRFDTSRSTSILTNNGCLEVSPDTDFIVSREPGKSIRLVQKSYSLTNTGYENIDWSVTSTVDWIRFSTYSGTLSPQTSTYINVLFSNTASYLTTGTYEGTIVFTNTTNGLGNITRTVVLNIAPGYLDVTPQTGICSVGELGGPFTPSNSSFILKNTGYDDIAWTASKEEDWIDLSSTSSTLAPGAYIILTTSINSNANALAAGHYSDTISFINTTNSMGDTTRSVDLAVGKIVFVDKNCGSSLEDGTSWKTAFKTVTAGVNAAISGQEIWVAGGNYGEIFSLKPDIAIRGGYNPSTGERDIKDNASIIGGVIAADYSTVDGFTISGTGEYGIYCDTITSPAIINNTIEGFNYGLLCGNFKGTAYINANKFLNTGYAIYCPPSGYAKITNNIVNDAYVGIYAFYLSGSISNNLVINSKYGISFDYCMSNTNNNIVCNCGCGISVRTDGFRSPTFLNNDLFENHVDYTGVEEPTSDLHVDPLFINSDAGDFHIPFDSPCIDAGTTSEAPDNDFDGNPRPVDGNGDAITAVDIGPYEEPFTLKIIAVTPSKSFLAVGNSGGPFNPSSIIYTIKNISTSDINWTVSNTQDWLSLSCSAGNLAPGETTALTASLNENAPALPNDTYTDNLIFTDLTTGQGATTRSVKLIVGPVFINKNASGSIHNGKSWETAFLTLQEGINAALAGQEVWVARGTYNEECITITKNVTLKGGFEGNGITRDIKTYQTIIQGPSTSNDIFIIEKQSTIDGFTISGGSYGIWLSYAPATIINNTFNANQNFSISGHSSVGSVVSNNRFIGRGITIGGTNWLVSGNILAIDEGYGVSIYGSSNHKIIGNFIIGGSCAISCDDTLALSVINNIISNTIYGFRSTNTTGTIANNTITNCKYGVFCYPGSPDASNNIIAYCTTGIYKWFSEPTMNLSHNNIYGCTKAYYPISMPHPTDIECNPMFISRLNGDFHLLPESSCIDSGDETGAPNEDIEGITRPRDGNGDGIANVDIGCYETPNNYVSISNAKSIPDGDPVGTYSTTTATFSDRFYIENADRISGIGVLGTMSNAGKAAVVEGNMITIDGERVISSLLVQEIGSVPVPMPLYLNPNAIGGGSLGLQEGTQDYRLVPHFDENHQATWYRDLFTYGGANNIGLLIKTTGRVKLIGSNDLFYLDGAAGFDDGDVNIKGIAIAWPFGADTMPPDGSPIDVVGISSCTIKDGIVVRLLRPISENSYKVW